MSAKPETKAPVDDFIVGDDDDYSEDSDFSDAEESPQALARGLPKAPKEPPSPPQVAIKYRFEGSLRRANISLPLSFKKLTKQIADSFPAQRNSDLVISYRDEENDTPVIATDEELQAAYDCFKSTGRILLLDVSIESVPKAVNIPAVQVPVATRAVRAREKRRLRIEKRAKLRKLRAEATKQARAKATANAKTTAKTVSPPIIATVTSGCGGFQPPRFQQQTQAQPHQQAHPASANKRWMLPPATRVRIRISPLDVTRMHHNNKCGRVLFFDAQIGRYLVTVDGDTANADTFSPEEITAIGSPGSAIRFKQPARQFIPANVLRPSAPVRRCNNNRARGIDNRRNGNRPNADKMRRQDCIFFLRPLTVTVFAFALAGCCGAFFALIVSILLSINGRRNLRNFRRPQDRKRRKKRDFDDFQRNMYTCEGSELFQAIPFIQILLIALSFIFGANWSMTVAALLSYFGLGVKAARAVCYCRTNRVCSDTCRLKICKFMTRCDNEEVVCGGVGHRQLRCAFGMCLVAAAALVVVIKFPTPLFWITAFAPRIPQPVFKSPETPTTATNSSPVVSSVRTSARTSPAAAAPAVVAQSTAAPPVSATRTTSSRQPAPASLQEARVTHLVSKIIAGIEQAPLTYRSDLSNALARALGKAQRLGRDSKVGDFKFVKSMLKSCGVNVDRM